MGNYLIPNNIKAKSSPFRRNITPDKWQFGYDTLGPLGTEVNICPKNYKKFVEDVSYPTGKNSNEYKDFFKDIPKIYIREYLMDLPEDRWLDILITTYLTMKDRFEKWKNNPESYKAAFNKDKLRESLLTFINSIYGSAKNPEMKKSKTVDELLWYDFTVFVYRQLMSYDILNYYELPYSGSINFGSNGNLGWKGSKLLKEGFKFISDINIDRVPMWKYEGAEGDTIQFELLLFNDTFNSACTNFRFINTIIPDNMWLQYALFQHNPCVYDILFQGGLRYFCCSLDIKCENIGNNRIPPKNFFDTVRDTGKSEIFSKLPEADIRIPDAYKVTFNFKSLLPNNFNQYMMTYREEDYITYPKYDRHETIQKDVPKAVLDALDKAFQ